jgi:hypothetical protein
MGLGDGGGIPLPKEGVVQIDKGKFARGNRRLNQF